MNAQTSSHAVGFASPRSKDTQETINLAEDYLEVVGFLDRWLRRSIRLCEFVLQCNQMEDVELIRDRLVLPGAAANIFNLHSGVDATFRRDTIKQLLYFSVGELNLVHTAWFTRNKKFAMKLSCDYKHEMLLEREESGRVKTTVPRMAFRPTFTALNENADLAMEPGDLYRLIRLRQRTEEHLMSLEEIRSATDDFVVAEVLFESFRKIPCVGRLFKSKDALSAFCKHTGQALVSNCEQAMAFIDLHETDAWCTAIRNEADRLENVLDTPDEFEAPAAAGCVNKRKTTTA